MTKCDCTKGSVNKSLHPTEKEIKFLQSREFNQKYLGGSVWR